MGTDMAESPEHDDTQPSPAGFNRFLVGLKRRRVGRVAVTYLAVSWFIVEVAGTTFPIIGLPDGLARLLIVLLAIGFPIALVLSWIFDFGPAGIEVTDADSLDPVAARPSRGWALIAAGAAVGAGLVWAMPRLAAKTGATGDEEALSASMIAVLPFSVRGSEELAYLGEGIVDLVSAKLNGAGTISTADPRLVISDLRKQKGDPADPATGRAVARGVGAGRYVTGEVLEVGGKVRLTAALHSTVDTGGSPPQASAEGQADEIFGLLDRLVAELLAGTLLAEGERFEALATRTTSSLDAAKAYLEGERLIRQGLYREAAVAFDEAVAADSTFALAYYRKSIAAEWIDAYTARTDADRAYAFREALPPRDQGLVGALRLRRHGQITESEQALRALLHEYPDDVEALVQLGELYFHDNPRGGRSIDASIEPFERALALEPLNPIPSIHLGRIYALNDSVRLLKGVVDSLTDHAPDSERTLEAAALYAYMTGDSAIKQQVKEQLQHRPWYYTFHVAHGVGRFARDPFGASDLLASRPSDDPLLLALVPNQHVVMGKYAAANEFLDRRRLERDASWDIYRAFLLTSGAMPPDPDRMASLLDVLANMTPADIRGTAWLQPYEDITDRFLGYQRDYYRALILIQLGRLDEAEPIVAALRAQPEFEALGSFKTDAEASLRAETLLQQGDREGALEALRSMRLEIPHALSYQPAPEQSRARFLRGRLEIEVGDPALGIDYLVGLDEAWGVWDTYHRPLAYRLLGTLAEEQGRTADAVRYYTWLVWLWREGDPELVQQREEIEARLYALTG